MNEVAAGCMEKDMPNKPLHAQTWDWWKAKVFQLRESKDYAEAEALFLEFKVRKSE